MSNLQEFFGALTPTRDRRLNTRTTLASLTYVELRESNGGMVLDISEAGMALAVADAYIVGEYLLRIRFPLPISSQSFEISAQIVWLSESKNGAGIRFVDLTPDVRNQISHWIESEKQALEFEQLLKPLRREKQTVGVSPRKSRRIFSNPSVRDEAAAAGYAELFPSESAGSKRAVTSDEIKPQQGPLPISACTPTDSDVSMLGSTAGISTGEVPQSLTASFPSEHAKNFSSQPIKTSIPELNGNLTPERVESLIPATLENSSTEALGSFSREQVQSSSPELVADVEPRAFEFVVPEIPDASGLSLVEDLQGKIYERTPVPGFGLRVLTDKIGSLPARIGDSPLLFYVPERSAERGFGFHLVAVVCLFAVIGIIIELTGGLGPLGKRLRDVQKTMPVANPTSAALPNRTGGLTPRTPTQSAANTFNAPVAHLPAPHTEESRSKDLSALYHKARPADSATRVSPIGPSSAVTGRSKIDSDNSLGANKINDATPSEEKSEESTLSSESWANVPSKDLDFSSTTGSKPSADLESIPKGNGSDRLVARNGPVAAKTELPRPPLASGPTTAKPKNPAPRSVTSTTSAIPYRLRPPAILVTRPSEGSTPSKLIFPEKAIAVSSTFAIASQLSVLVSPEPGPAAAHQPVRLQAGELLFYAEPHFPNPGNKHGSTETVKLRATIGQQGQVIDLTPVSGPTSLLPAAMDALRKWRYTPTLLNERPIQFQQDVTIEFRPTQRLSHEPG